MNWQELLRIELPDLEPRYLYHPGHVWACIDDPERVRIGVDPFAIRIAGRLRSIVMPPRGLQLRRGHPCAWLDTPGGTLGVLAPFSGAVLAANPAIGTAAQRLHADPFESGWLLDLLPSALAADSARLEPAQAFARRLARDTTRWQSMIRRAVRPQVPRVGPTLADGHLPVATLDELLGARRRAAIAAYFFAGGRAVH
jgi:glycine cleavage system H lipoate-binding protein